MKKISSPLDLNGTGYCASFNFRKTARAVTRLYDAALQESGIRSTQFAILVGIAKNQPVSIGRLGDLLVIDSTTLTRSLRLLQKEGFIAISNRAAMRQRFLTVTAKGERVLARSLPAWRKAQ
jgi:DNA-binding MarR family transcriptional regulator